MVDICFNISPQTRNLLSKQISKTKSTNQLDMFGWLVFMAYQPLLVI